MKQCLFDENTADYGGAIFRGSTDGNIIGNVFETNKATRIGGAIYDSHAKVCLSMLHFHKHHIPWRAAPKTLLSHILPARLVWTCRRLQAFWSIISWSYRDGLHCNQL